MGGVSSPNTPSTIEAELEELLRMGFGEEFGI